MHDVLTAELPTAYAQAFERWPVSSENVHSPQGEGIQEEVTVQTADKMDGAGCWLMWA